MTRLLQIQRFMTKTLHYSYNIIFMKKIVRVKNELVFLLFVK